MKLKLPGFLSAIVDAFVDSYVFTFTVGNIFALAL